ncbi:MAG: HDIG domain-containing protein, partial [Dehalococcoidia bacterium]|nr:HDIG domain-containing protein [Dehalococcoidia bacterium]
MHRDEAWKIMLEYAKEERTHKHGIAVEAVMQAYARELHEDEEKWGIVGLLHDFDWEIHPTEELHPRAGSELLAARGVPEDIRYAILCHAP